MHRRSLDYLYPFSAVFCDPREPAAGDPPAGDPPPADPPAGDPPPGDPPNPPANDEAARMRKQFEDLQKELDGYKRRDEDQRKAKLTEEQRLKEERDQLAADNEKLRQEAMRTKVAGEFKLPPALAARLIGSDEAAMRADAAELAKLLPKPKVGSATDPVKDGQQPPTFKRSQLRDPAFFNTNRDAILQAQRDGRITND